MTPSQSDTAKHWRRGVEAAVIYNRLHGDLRVPFTFRVPAADGQEAEGEGRPASLAGFPLGQWTADARRFYARGDMDEDRIAQLEKLGMIWSHYDVAWEEGLSAARGWAAEHGHLLAPLDATYQGYRVGTFLKNARAAARKAQENEHARANSSAIRRTLQRTAAGRLTTLPTKTRASERRIALPTRCVQSLKYHHEQQRELEAAGTTWQHDGHVFTTTQGRPIDPTNLTRAFITLLRKAGLRRIRLHDLRHWTAILLLEQGVEPVVIKELHGHAHIDVTATVYAHVRIRLQRDAIDTLSTVLGTPEIAKTVNSNDDEPPPCPALVR